MSKADLSKHKNAGFYVELDDIEVKFRKDRATIEKKYAPTPQQEQLRMKMEEKIEEMR